MNEFRPNDGSPDINIPGPDHLLELSSTDHVRFTLGLDAFLADPTRKSPDSLTGSEHDERVHGFAKLRRWDEAIKEQRTPGAPAEVSPPARLSVEEAGQEFDWD